jgi:hypothetical protein
MCRQMLENFRISEFYDNPFIGSEFSRDNRSGKANAHILTANFHRGYSRICSNLKCS